MGESHGRICSNGSRAGLLPLGMALAAACLLAGCKREDAPTPDKAGEPSTQASATPSLPSPGSANGAVATPPGQAAKVWQASGGGPQLNVAGEVDELDKPFQLSGVIVGGRAVFSYEPDGADKGVVSYKISGSGVTGAGTGSYTIESEGADERLLKQTTRGCIDGIPNSCRTNNDRIKLKLVAKQ